MFEKIIAAIKSILHPGRADLTNAEVSRALDERAIGLEWRTSIVDLLKILGLDSSLEARRNLANELGYALLYTGTETDNRWLHHTVLDEIAKRGIKIP